MDKEYEILDIISSHNEVSQRDISTHLGISLGSVNILLKKMVREGLIKIEKIPSNRVVYMLTPQGINEKIHKTFNYVRIHYNAIEGYKAKIKSLLESFDIEGSEIYICIENWELTQIFKDVIVAGKINVKIIEKTDIHQLSDYSTVITSKGYLDEDHHEKLKLVYIEEMI